jgi:hypothetical protein
LGNIMGYKPKAVNVVKLEKYLKEKANGK